MIDSVSFWKEGKQFSREIKIPAFSFLVYDLGTCLVMVCSVSLLLACTGEKIIFILTRFQLVFEDF